MGDLNNGGWPDVYVSNDYAGKDFLKGDGAGIFAAVPAYEDGLILDGEVREISLIKLGKIKARGIIAAKNSDKIRIVRIGGQPEINR